MKLFILTILTSSVVSLAVSYWYSLQMAKMAGKYFDDFYKQMGNEYKEFLDKCKNQ